MVSTSVFVTRFADAILTASVQDNWSHEGFLEKKSPALMAGWQKRWFVLKEVRCAFSLVVPTSQERSRRRSFLKSRCMHRAT